jgi:hypothetical protein
MTTREPDRDTPAKLLLGDDVPPVFALVFDDGGVRNEPELSTGSVEAVSELEVVLLGEVDREAADLFERTPRD